MKYEVKINSFKEFEDVDVWCQQFSDAFDMQLSEVFSIFDKKYLKNKGFIATLWSDNILRASYSVIELESQHGKFGLSVDTFSDGYVRSSTVKICEVLYPFLKDRGFDGLFGFPNSSILTIRTRKLGWHFVSNYRMSLCIANGIKPSFSFRRSRTPYSLRGLMRKLLYIWLLAFDVKFLPVAPSKVSQRFVKTLCYKALLSPCPIDEPNICINSIDVP